jgi:hypothetical protein
MPESWAGSLVERVDAQESKTHCQVQSEVVKELASRRRGNVRLTTRAKRQDHRESRTEKGWFCRDCMESVRPLRQERRLIAQPVGVARWKILLRSLFADKLWHELMDDAAGQSFVEQFDILETRADRRGPGFGL